MAIGPALPWGRANISRAWTRFFVPLSGAILTPGAMYLLAIANTWFSGGHEGWSDRHAYALEIISHPYVVLSASLCVFALIANVDEFLLPVRQRIKAKKEAPHTAMWEVARRGRRRFGGHIAHLGVIMAVLSMAAAKGYRQEQYFTTGPGNAHEFAEYTLSFEGTRISEEGFRKGVLGDFRLSRYGKDLGIYTPRINHYKTRREPLPAPVSLVYWNHDLQLTLMSADEDGSFAYLRVIKSPFIAWLWFSAFVILLGTILSIWPSSKLRAQKRATE